MDRFAYFFATFAQMESDRSNSQNRVSHAADLSSSLPQAARGVPLRQLKDLVAQKRDYIIIRESYASFFIADCCPRAASGHAAIEPAINLMKSRRLMQPAPGLRTTLILFKVQPSRHHRVECCL